MFFFASIFEFYWGKERDSRCIPSKEREVGLVRYLGVVRKSCIMSIMFVVIQSM